MATNEPPPLVTECPNCHTRFRVGESQLQIAHGRVRCGACLAVFAGVDHLLLDDSMPTPELPAETNMLESVLAELAQEDGVADEPAEAVDQSVTSARAYELDALAARRGDTQELELSGGFLAADEPAATEADIVLEAAEEVDWTHVSVDTQELGPRVTLELARSGESRRFEDAPDRTEDEPSERDLPAAEAAPRATLEDALESEEALRWWLEDELPGGSGSGGDDPASADDADDGMVVQLSELDAVNNDDLDLKVLLEQPDNGSKGQLEALFRELREEEEAEDEAVEEAEAGAATRADQNARPIEAQKQAQKQAPKEVPTEAPKEVLAGAEAAAKSGEQALRKVVSDLRADAASPPPSDLVEQSADELHKAIDQAEPLVSRAMTSSALAASANKVAAAERAAEARQAAVPPAEASGSAETETQPTLPNRGVELVEPPAARRADQAANALATPEIPAVASAATIAGGPAAAPISDGFEAPPGAEPLAPVDSLWDRAKAGIERLLTNPHTLRAGTLLASVLLVIQIMFWQFDDWAKSPALRPVYGSICSVIGCELPVRRSVRDMQSRKLAVRSHPDEANKLLVDALIINEAEFAQPFPVIELQFMDLNQQLVGSYRLEPDSYLDGELAGTDALMAVRTPIHIDIEIADPGPTAVNYQLQFR